MPFWIRKPKKVGLALGGGAARGLAHIGVLKVLKEFEIPVHFVAGTSSGALMGALFAAGMEPEVMDKGARRVGWTRLVRVTLARTAPLSSEALENFIIQNIGDLDFTSLKVPFQIVATDFKSGEKVVLREGKVARAVAASSAFPGILAPVKIHKKLLMDGCMVENVPVETVKSMGAEVVIAVEVIPEAAPPKDPENIIEVIDRSINLVLRGLSKEAKAKAEILIEPLTEYVNSLDLDQADRLIKMGEEAAKKAIEKIKSKIR